MEWSDTVTRFTATEADMSRFNGLSRRFSDHPVISPRFLLLPDDSAEFRAAHSAAVAYNVLEHIPDHVGALRSMAELVRPGGALILIVPAFPSAMSRFDRAIGHERRYTTASLTAALTEAGLTVNEVRYVNPIGLISWYVTVKTLGMTPRNGLLLRVYDRIVVPMARLADQHIRAPFGQSVFAVARVPA